MAGETGAGVGIDGRCENADYDTAIDGFGDRLSGCFERSP